FNGSALCGFDRTKMLAGNASAAQICKSTPNTEGGYLPSDLDGPTPPADRTPGLFKRQVALARALRSRRKGHTYRAASTRRYSRSASVVGNSEIAARGNTGDVQRCRSGVGPRDALRLTGHTDDRLREAQLRSGKRHC